MDQTRIGFDKTGAPVSTGFEPQWHRIFPRGVLKKAGVSDDEIHALANITVLNERTNLNKLSRYLPAHYIKKFNIPEEILRNHLIPEPLVPRWPSWKRSLSPWLDSMPKVIAY
ncbi:MAG TPA: hypothetical protein EYP19_10570, partial [Desulfobacterales bacterium]|nr:hypothetical protein [Desulfobacterales bacterium]